MGQGLTAPHFPLLFSPLRLRHLTLRNRIVSTAHGTFMSVDGLPTERIAAYQAARAAGGVGLIIHEASSVHQSGVGASRYATCHTDACIPGYRRIAKAVHDHGGIIFGQLYHPGRGDIAGSSDDGSIAVSYAPSAVPCERLQLMPRPMPLNLVREVISAYGSAAGRFKQAGMDGIEIMAHHGHLVSQFLNPRTNRRDDAYGGSFENRLRFLSEIVVEVRGAVGDEPPIGLRISGDEMGNDGLTSEEALAVCVAADRLGEIDYFHVIAGSCSNFDGGIHVVPPMAIEPGYVAPYAARIRSQVTKPVLVTGRINRPEVAERILADRQADFCGMTRAMICDPDLANKTREGRLADIRYCIGCNQACIGHAAKGAAISCIQFPESGRELVYGRRTAAQRRRRVLVAGGGPAGMKAAAVAAERGHDVTLFEKADRLGGQALLAQLLPGRMEFGGIVSNLAREVERAGVKVLLGTPVTADLVLEQAPDAFVIATGALPYRPVIPGSDSGQVVDAWQVLRDQVNVGASVVIADGRLDGVAMGLAERFARAGCRVRLAVAGYMAGQNLQAMVRDHWAGILYGLDVEVLTYLRIARVDGRDVAFEHVASRAPVSLTDVDTLVLALGQIQNAPLERELADWSGELHMIGDCLTPRTAEEAVLEGLKVGAAL